MGTSNALILLGLLLGGAILAGGWFAVHQMTRRNRAEMALAYSEHQFKVLIENIRDGLTYSDETGKFELFNEAMIAICGYTMEEANTLPDYIHLIHPNPEDVQQAFEGMIQVMQTGQTIGRETVMLSKSGERKELLVSSALVRLSGKTGFLTTYHDVTARRKAERERETLITQLQAALHDVRTLRGLLPICGWCKKIRDDEGNFQDLETYITARSSAKFTHGICPNCAKTFVQEGAED